MATTSPVGALDECVQAIRPTRVFEWIEILLNITAGVMSDAASVALGHARRAPHRDE